ncbi:MAG: kynureninase, partial [Renibacterium salmoninarum]|nr:kynureninase [Renibacterium salmoninarum]
PDYRPAAGIRGFTSGTPPILGMTALRDMVELIDAVGIDAVRAKSVALTDYAVALYDGVLAPLGVELASPRDPARRGGHVTIDHPAFRTVTEQLWEQGIIPDFRNPDGIRLGLSPLSTSFTELWIGVDAIRAALGTNR